MTSHFRVPRSLDGVEASFPRLVELRPKQRKEAKDGGYWDDAAWELRWIGR